MCNEVRVTREILNANGILSSPRFSDIQVRFDLIETQDFVDGIAGGKFSYGNLRFVDKPAAPVREFLMSHTRLVLKGGGIQTTVCFNELNAFTVVSEILGDLPSPRIFHIFRWSLPLARLLQGRQKRSAASAWMSRKASTKTSGISRTNRLSRA